jgi:hypothetical protein
VSGPAAREPELTNAQRLVEEIRHGWSMATVEAYRESQPHTEIREATRGLTNEPVAVKTDEIVP